MGRRADVQSLRSIVQSPKPGVWCGKGAGWSLTKDQDQKPALAKEGEGGMEEAKIVSYFVASARAPETGTIGESIPTFAQRK